MKIGYLLTTYPSNSETFIAREMDHLRQRGVRITVFAAGGGPVSRPGQGEFPVFYRPARISKAAALSILRLLVRYPRGMASLLVHILRTMAVCPREALTIAANLHTLGCFAGQMECESIQHVHACFMSWPATIALAISIATGRSFSIGAHARDVFVEGGDVEAKVSRSLFVTGCNRQVLARLESRLSPVARSKLKLNYHGIDVSEERGCVEWQSRREDATNRRVLGIGRFVAKKGFADLVRAFALIVGGNPHCRLLLVGDGPERASLCRLVDELSLGGSVEMPGWQHPDAVRRLLTAADVLVVPSVIAADGDRDGVPNVILEASAAGTPVLATNLAGICEVVRDGWNGLLVSPGDIPALASALRQLLEDQPLRAHLVHNARATAIERFDIHETVGQLARLFPGIGDGSHIGENRAYC